MLQPFVEILFKNESETSSHILYGLVFSLLGILSLPKQKLSLFTTMEPTCLAVSL